MRYQVGATKYLLDEESSALERFLRHLLLPENARDAVMLLTLLYTGARASEMLAIESQHVIGTKVNGKTYRSVFIKGLKGSLDREIPIPEWLFDELKKLSPAKGRLFPISYKRLDQIWRKYRPVEKKLHALRHTFAITQLRKHGRLDVIKKLLGHVSVQNTMVYSDYANTQEELERMVL